MRSRVFDDVAREVQCNPLRSYDVAVHERVDGLVQEWVQNILPYGGERSLAESMQRCDAFARREYVARYRACPEHLVCGCPLFGFVLLAIIGGAISWYVQRTLTRMFPRESAGSAGA